MGTAIGGGSGGYTQGLGSLAQAASDRVEGSASTPGLSTGGLSFGGFGRAVKGLFGPPKAKTPLEKQYESTVRQQEFLKTPGSPTKAPPAAVAAPKEAAPKEKPVERQPLLTPRQGLVGPDRTLLERYFRDRALQGGGRSTVLSQLYRLPEDQNVAARALQNFNTRLGGSTVLGRTR